VVQRSHMPHKLDTRVRLEVGDELCRVMTRHIVVLVPPRDILRIEEISTTWRCLPHDMMMLMCHIFGAFNLIDMLRDGAHDHTTSSSSIEPSTSSTPPHDPSSPPDSPPHGLTASSSVHPSTSNPPPISPPHVSKPVSTVRPPPPLPLLVSPSVDHCISPSPHVLSSIDPPLTPLPPHVSQAFDALDTMITSSTVNAHIHDIDIKTLDSALMPTFAYEIIVLDRGSTSGSRDTDLALVVDLDSSGTIDIYTDCFIFDSRSIYDMFIAYFVEMYV
jgi:hypothetical protein